MQIIALLDLDIISAKDGMKIFPDKMLVLLLYWLKGEMKRKQLSQAKLSASPYLGD